MSEQALNAGDQLVAELTGEAWQKDSPAPTMGRLKRCSYTHDAMIDLIIQHPGMDQNHLAAHFGYTPSWVSNILASDAFQAKLAARREEVIDPEIKASLEERFRALTIQSVKVLMDKLSGPANTVSPAIALKAAELGAKALRIGALSTVPETPAVDRLERLAGRLLSLNQPAPERIINGQAAEVLEPLPVSQAA